MLTLVCYLFLNDIKHIKCIDIKCLLKFKVFKIYWNVPFSQK